MSAAALMSPGVAKEVRALLPVWVLVVLSLAGSFLWGDYILVGFIAYGIGVLALGAQSVGQEYSYRTLPLLLAQPIARRGLLVRKAAVLLPMLLTVLVIAGLVFPYAYGRSYASSSGMLVLLMPVLCALLLTPWLTMLCRSVLAGVVFSIALPGMILALTSRMGVGIAVMLVLCVVTGALGWRRFMNLEALEADERALQFPVALRCRPGQHPLWMLALKELHLQQLTFALVGVYIVLWIAVAVVPRSLSGADLSLDIVTLLFLFLLPLLIGSLASAEERHYGTLEWQQLQPVSASRQWMVKVAVVFGLTVAFALALPWLLGMIRGAITGHRESFRAAFAMVVIVLAGGSLYISSLSRSGMQAAMLSIAILPAAGAAYFGIVRMAMDSAAWLGYKTHFSGPAQLVYTTASVALAFFVVVMLVRFAQLNHRSAERTAANVQRQVLLMILCLLVGAAVIAGSIAGAQR